MSPSSSSFASPCKTSSWRRSHRPTTVQCCKQIYCRIKNDKGLVVCVEVLGLLSIECTAIEKLCNTKYAHYFYSLYYLRTSKSWFVWELLNYNWSYTSFWVLYTCTSAHRECPYLSSNSIHTPSLVTRPSFNTPTGIKGGSGEYSTADFTLNISLVHHS